MEENNHKPQAETEPMTPSPAETGSDKKPAHLPTPKQQVVEKLKTAERILITAHQDPDGDALGSCLGLQRVLAKLGKQVTVAIAGQIDRNLKFLPEVDKVANQIEAEPEFMIVLNEEQSKAKNVEVRRLDNNQVALVVTADTGRFKPNQVSFQDGRYPFDVIVALDCANQEQIGKLASTNQELFSKVPLVSIDHHSSNTNFGEVNFVDTNAAATAEIMVSIIESLGQNNGKTVNLINEPVATCLLTGLMTDTGSFQNSNTTPKSLTVTAQLLASGGQHALIVKEIFKSMPEEQLKLWGIALTKIKVDRPLGFAWATLSRADFNQTKAGEEAVSGLIDKLLKSLTGVDFVLLLSERESGLHGSLRSANNQFNVEILAKLFGGGGHKQAAAFLVKEGTLAEHEQRVINAISQQLRAKQE